MENKFVIIDESSILGNIEALRMVRDCAEDNDKDYYNGQINLLRSIIGESNELRPILESVYDEAFKSGYSVGKLKSNNNPFEKIRSFMKKEFLNKYNIKFL